MAWLITTLDLQAVLAQRALLSQLSSRYQLRLMARTLSACRIVPNLSMHYVSLSAMVFRSLSGHCKDKSVKSHMKVSLNSLMEALWAPYQFSISPFPAMNPIFLHTSRKVQRRPMRRKPSRGEEPLED